MLKDKIAQAILQVAKQKKVFAFADVSKFIKFPASRQYIALVFLELVDNKLLVKTGLGRWTKYSLPQNQQLLSNTISKQFTNKGLEEDRVFDYFQNAASFWPKLKENVQSLVRYGFMEMVNNAIEHSGSNTIRVNIQKTDNDLIFRVRDFGVGVFRNVMTKKNLKSELEAIQDLLKGKTTTAPKAHSGEGIFFTSKAADWYVLESFGLSLRIDNILGDVFVEEAPKSVAGTLVIFKVDLNSKRHLRAIFEKFQTDPEEYGFDRTEIKIKLYTLGTIYISRSQARRVLVGLEKFKSVIFDFDQVPTVGQAFADEIFRVFKSRHPEIKIQATNMNRAVEFMVKRVGK